MSQSNQSNEYNRLFEQYNKILGIISALYLGYEIQNYFTSLPF